MLTSVENQVEVLEDKATLLRIHSIRETTAAGSGHPTSCASAAEIVSTLFFSVMRFDPTRPGDIANDAFILSKGHAAPLLYAAWAEAGAIPIQELTKLRTFGSNLEGHPTPRLPFVGVATGSLGQGLSAGIGMAFAARLDHSNRRIYVLMGDGESAEGSVWEAAEVASHYSLENLCATIDINRLAQSGPTMDGHHLDVFRRRWEAFGWHAIEVDGHDVAALTRAYEIAQETTDRPTIVLARTIKGKDIPGEEDKNGFHGKPLDAAKAERVILALKSKLNGKSSGWKPHLPGRSGMLPGNAAVMNGMALASPPYSPKSKPESTRKAFGEALAALGVANSSVVALDGDVQNSTYTEDFEKLHPERFFEMFIAEQNMVGAALGFSAAHKIPFASTFACFMTRAYDFMRMGAIGHNNIKLVGTHAGVSIGEDGPSQMGLEDLAMTCAQPNFTVLYPSDAVSAWKAVGLAASHAGPVYIRTSRPKTPVIYEHGEEFKIGGAKILRRSDSDQAVVVAAGVTLFEALSAYDQLSAEGIHVCVVDLFSIQPIDKAAILSCCRVGRQRVITVEDHYSHGGLGDAVNAALALENVLIEKLAVREIPRSGKPEELLEHYGISANAIVAAVRRMIQARN